MTSFSSVSLLERARLAAPQLTEREAVVRVAEQVLSEAGIDEPPVNVQWIASTLDIARIVYDRDLLEAGCLICGPDAVEIRIRATDSRGRRRFTVCHECGHVFFPGFHLTTQFRCAPKPAAISNDLETLCDLAASELLLPTRMVRPRAREASFGFDGLQQLADVFDCSLVAAGYSFIRAWTDPAALLAFERGTRKSEIGTSAPARLRLRSAMTAGNWPWFRNNKSVKPDDVFDRALQGEVIDGEVTLIEGLCNEPVRVEAHVRLVPYHDEHGRQHMRVLGLIRQHGQNRNRG